MRDTSYIITSSSSYPPFPSFPFPFPFPWPASCSLPRTLSFRSAKEEGSSTTELQRLSNSPSAAAAEEEATAESQSFSSTASEGSAGEAVEEVISRLRSADRRLFFDPGSAASSSIVEAAGGVPFEGSVAVVVESLDPYGDFRRSMEEMVAARGGRTRTAASPEWMEEMLRWYLRANAKKTHGVIVLAFTDLLSILPPPPPPSSSATTFEEEDDKM